jgi:hypothetical protein
VDLNWYRDLERMSADIETMRALLVSSVPARSVVLGVGTTSAVNNPPRTASVTGAGVITAKATLRAPATVAGVGTTTATHV